MGLGSRIEGRSRRVRGAGTGARLLALAAVMVAGGLCGCSLGGEARAGDSPVPVTAVKRGDVQLEVQATGTLSVTHSVELMAPPIGGGTLEIIRLLRTGTPVKAGEVVVAFDPSGQEYDLAQNRSDLEQAQETITQAKANAAVQAAQDQTALLKAQFGVRQAELKVKMNEMVSAIEAKENLLALDAAKRTLVQTQQDIQSHAATNQAALSVAQQALAKARLGMEQAQQNLGKMQLKSPIDGMVVIAGNFSATGGIYFGGMALPEFQVGDQVNPGNDVVQVIDLSHMELSAEIPQGEGADVQTGDPVEIHVDAIPGAGSPGKVVSSGGIATSFVGTGLEAKARLTIGFDHPDPRLRPGFTARALIFGRRIKDAVTVPREAVFNLTGTPAVYVKQGSGFVRRPVTIRYLTDASAVIAGLDPGTEIALINPQQPQQPSAAPAAQAPAAGAAGPVVVRGVR